MTWQVVLLGPGGSGPQPEWVLNQGSTFTPLVLCSLVVLCICSHVACNSRPEPVFSHILH